MTKELKEIEKVENMNLPVFASGQNFELAQRIATALAKSDLVPKEYQNNISNCLIALEMSNRIGASPLMIMQHLYIVHGKPSWSSTFIIAAVNSCGRFNPLNFEIKSTGIKKDTPYIEYIWEPGSKKPRAISKIYSQEYNNLECIAFASLKNNPKKILESPRVSIEIAIKEGWFTKEGSKWKTMPELMLRYRAAAFFGRLYAPEITMGMQSVEEIKDIIDVEIIEDEVKKSENVAKNIIDESMKKSVKSEDEKQEIINGKSQKLNL